MSEIRGTLEQIRKRLNEFLWTASPRHDDWVILSDIVDQSGQPIQEAQEKVVMFLAGIQKETAVSTYNPNVPIAGNRYAVVAPPLYVDLFVLMYANFSGKNYAEGLSAIQRTITFFQQNLWFTHDNLPGLDPRIGKLTFELTNLDPIDLNYILGPDRREIPSLGLLQGEDDPVRKRRHAGAGAGGAGRAGSGGGPGPMSAKLPASRTFERTLRAPFRFPIKEGRYQDGLQSTQRDPRQFFYQTLMRVAVHHTYYNSSGFLCPAFGFTPTPASAALMAKLGIIFRTEETGFSVLYDEIRQDDLIRFLRRQAEEGEVWTRLSFQMPLENDYFVNLTEIPIATEASAENFYFSNQRAHPREGLLLLNPGRRVDARQLLPVVPGQLPVPAEIDGRKVDEVQVYDIAGDRVLCVPRCVTRKAAELKNPADFTCADKCRCPHEDCACAGERCCRCTDMIYVNFASLREDKYTLKIIDSAGDPIVEPMDVLWTFFYPMPLCFIDLLFTSPQGRKPENYPVRGLFSDRPEIVTADYTLRFERRSTLWNYYIVPPQPGVLEDLRIENLSPFPVEFAGPCKVFLPDGREAFRFLSKQPLPLQEQPECNFRLRGRHKHWPHEKTLVDRLPAASSQQVLPEPPSVSCAELQASLAPHEAERPRCKRLIDRVCRAGDLRRNYSAIYVYV